MVRYGRSMSSMGARDACDGATLVVSETAWIFLMIRGSRIQAELYWHVEGRGVATAMHG